MSLLSRLFGAKSTPKGPEAVLHKDCRIFVEPIKEASGFRVAARIEKDIAGVTKTHQMVRADTIPSLDQAQEITLNKAKQAIDQLGDQLFS